MRCVVVGGCCCWGFCCCFGWFFILFGDITCASEFIFQSRIADGTTVPHHVHPPTKPHHESPATSIQVLCAHSRTYHECRDLDYFL